MLKDTETPVLAAQCYKTAPASYKQGLIFCLTRPRLAPIKDLECFHFACTSLLSCESKKGGTGSTYCKMGVFETPESCIELKKEI